MAGKSLTTRSYSAYIQGIADMYVDLGAQKLIAADRSGQKIAVEVKSFIGTSTISEFHIAIGQFINYRYALELQEPERVLYLAVPLNTYNIFFIKTFVASVVQRSQINLVIYDIETEEITKWQT
jgi:XisH protein